MQVLIDECLPNRFRKQFPDHEVHKVHSTHWAGFGGKRNGELLRATDRSGYHVLITIDKGIPFQHNFSGISITLIVMRAKSNKLKDLIPFVARIRQILATNPKGLTYVEAE